MSIVEMFKRKTNRPPTSTEASSHPAAVIETQIRPRRHRFIGKRLAFLMDDDSIQMAAVIHLASSRRIAGFTKTYLPRDLGDAERQIFIGRAIDEFLAEYGRGRPQIVVSLGAIDSAFRTFHMPVLKKSELDSAVSFEAQKQIPFPIEQSIVGYRRLSKIVAGGRTRYRIALQAATKDKIETNLAPFRARGLLVEHVFQAQDAVGQLLELLPEYDCDASYVLLKVDHRYSEIAIYHGMSLEFIHVSSTGTSMIGQGGKSQREHLGETLASEIQTSLDYYSGLYRSPTFSKVYVYGDLAYADEIVSGLKTHFGYEFLRFPIEQLRGLGHHDREAFESAAVCLSSLGAAACNARLANLLPPEDVALHSQRRQHFWGQLSLATMVLLLLAGWWIVRNDLSTFREAALDATRRVQEFRSTKAYHRYNVLKSQIAGTQAYLSQARKDPSYLALNLKELSRLTPSGVTLKQLRFEDNSQSENFVIKGLAVSSDMPPEVLVAEYVEALNASPFYGDVVIKRHQKSETKNGFQIEFSIGLRGIV